MLSASTVSARGRLAAQVSRAHNPEIAGPNPAPATMPLPCDERGGGFLSFSRCRSASTLIGMGLSLGQRFAGSWRDAVRYGDAKRRADGPAGVPTDRFDPFEHGPSRARLRKARRAIRAELARRAGG